MGAEQAEHLLEQRNLELAALNAVPQALSASSALKDVLDEALSRTIHALGFAAGLISLTDVRGSELSMVSHVGLPLPLVELLRSRGLDGTLCDHMLRTREASSAADFGQGAPVDVGELVAMGLRSFAGAPIIHKDRVLGAFCLFDTVPHPIGESERDLLIAIGRQIGVAVENARLFEQTQAALGETEALFRVGQAISHLGSLEQTFQALADVLVDQLGYTSAWLALLDAQSEALREIGRAGPRTGTDAIAGDVRLGRPAHNPAVWAVLNRQPIVINDVAADPRAADLPERVRVALGRLVELPILLGDEPAGVVAVSRPLDMPEFTGRDVEMLVGVADQAAVALESTRLFEETRRRVGALQLLHDVGLAASSGIRLEGTLQAAVEALQARLEVIAVGILLLDPERGVLQLKASASESPDDLAGLEMPAGRGIVGWVAAHGRPLLVPDVRLDERYFEAIPGTRSELCVPLTVDSRVIGVLNVESAQVNAFTPDDLRLLSTLASHLVVVIERARLFDEVEAAGIELQERAQALEEANVRLQELDRLKSQFLANMSHELRTPLNSIIGFSEVMIEGMVGELQPEQKECLEHIRSGGHHLLRLINDILDISKIEAGYLELVPAPFDVAQLVSDVEATIAPLLEKKSQRLTVDLPEELPALVADHFRIKQVLLNLLANACKFTPDEGRIALSCELADASSMLFSVADSGIGIKPEDREIIFEEFRQADDSKAREMTGTGLGLAISKRLVEMHGGRIWVESTYGHGATFSFLVPLGGPPGEGAGADAGKGGGGQGEGDGLAARAPQDAHD